MLKKEITDKWSPEQLKSESDTQYANRIWKVCTCLECRHCTTYHEQTAWTDVLRGHCTV